jgi:hypothetical protein
VSKVCLLSDSTCAAYAAGEDGREDDDDMGSLRSGSHLGGAAEHLMVGLAHFCTTLCILFVRQNTAW